MFRAPQRAAGPAGRRPEIEDHDGASPLEASLSKRSSVVQSKLDASASPRDHDDDGGGYLPESSSLVGDKIARVLEHCVTQVTEESDNAAADDDDDDDESSAATDSEGEQVQSSKPKKTPLTDKEKELKRQKKQEKREKKRKKKEKKAKRKAKKDARKARHERKKIASQSSDPSEATTSHVEENETGTIQEEKHQETIQKESTCTRSAGVRSTATKQDEQANEEETHKDGSAAAAAIVAPALPPKSTKVNDGPPSSSHVQAAAALPLAAKPAEATASQPSDWIDHKTRLANGGERRPSGRPQVLARAPVVADSSGSSVYHPWTPSRSPTGQRRTVVGSDKLDSKMMQDAKKVGEDKDNKKKKEIVMGDDHDVEKGDLNPEDEESQEYIKEISDKSLDNPQGKPGAFNIQGNRQPSMQSTVMSENNTQFDADLGAPLVAHLVPEFEASYDKIVVAVEDDEPRRRRLWFVMAGLLLVFLVVGLVLAVTLGKNPTQEPPPEGPSLWYHVVDPIDGDVDSGEFGSSVSMCSDGSRVAIGAQGSGQVKVFELDVEGGRTRQIGQTLNHSIADMSDLNTSIIRSRIVVELASDCHVLAIGCPFCNVNNKDAAGEVGLYEYNSTSDSWEPLGNPHIIPGGGESDLSGASLALSQMGDRIAIGSPGSDAAGVNAGQVRVFHINHDTWELLGTPLNGTFPGEAFGVSVSLANKQSSATSIIAVGSSFTSDTCGGPESPEAVRAYEFRTGDWSQLGQGIVPEVFGIDTAWFVKLSSNGKRLVVSNLYLDPGGIGISEDNEGLYVAPFELDSQGKKWVSRGGNLHQYFPGKKSGYMISLSEDGQTIGMGDPGKGGINGGFLGHTHFFTFMEDRWCQLGPKILGASPGDMTGYSLSLSGDGKRMVIASPKSRAQGYEHGQVMVVELRLDIIVPMCNVTTVTTPVMTPHAYTTVEGWRLSLCNQTG